VRTDDLVLVQGLKDTRGTLAAWNRRPWPVIGAWLAGSLAVTAVLLFAVWVVAGVSTPDSSGVILPGVGSKPHLSDLGPILFRNSLVLALHAFACIAGFIAGSSLPQTAERYSGTWRWIHDKAGPLAIGFVVGATTFSLCTQAYVLGGAASTISAEFHRSPGGLLLTLLPHAVPELVALFLPLAAWIIASRRGQWNQLLAATFVTVAIAAPMLILSGLIEVFVWPKLLVG
jgi:hypothetical protein